MYKLTLSDIKYIYDLGYMSGRLDQAPATEEELLKFLSSNEDEI